MKYKFSSVDITAEVECIRERLVGMRMNQVYNIDNHTYLFKLAKSEEKALLLIESGSRFHTTQYEWPKTPAPSSFSMKLRKHLNNKRLESIEQLGTDRIVDFTFGSGEVSYHVILELYDRGNIVLTDHEYMIANILRARKDNEDVKFMVKEKYPIEKYLCSYKTPSLENIKTILSNCKPSDTVKKALLPHLVYGPGILEHIISSIGLKSNVKIKDMNETQIQNIFEGLKIGDEIMRNCKNIPSKGFIIQKCEGKITKDGIEDDMFSFQEFHPYLYKQHQQLNYLEFETFDMAIDEFFSKIESQKMDLKALQKEREALKKLENVKKDHEKRIEELHSVQEMNRIKASYVEMNQELVDRALLVVRSAIANKLSWDDIDDLVAEAQDRGDLTALAISKLKLDENHIVMKLGDPYEEDTDEKSFYLVDIDLDLTAFANAGRLYGVTRSAALKEKKTIESSNKAYKSAQVKTKQTLKEAAVMASINKARKVLWFEKFYWFISSENYLVIAGRDQQQNELLVKKYLQKNDVYVHADIHGASSVVIKSPGKDPVPAKTLTEAGVMALCYSVSWEAKVVNSCWWVHAHQVSKTAPTGEYLTTGSFMIRGKKNYLPPLSLIMGYGFIFHLAESSILNHVNERQSKLQDSSPSLAESMEQQEDDDVELQCDSGNSSDAEKDNDEDEPAEKEGGIGDIPEREQEGTDSESSDSPEEFPDTEVKMQISGGDQLTVKATPLYETVPEVTSTLEKVVYLGDDKPVVIKPDLGGNKKQQRQRQLSTQSSTKETAVQVKQQEVCPTPNNQNQLKRGQRGKLKKIKKKYKDQDEEERQLRIELLRTSFHKDKKKKSKKKDKPLETGLKNKNVRKVLREEDVRLLSEEDFVNVPEHLKVGDPDEGQDDIEEDITELNQQEMVLASLTGSPVPEDELLFAIPICAPYSVLTNYKYKVKLIPGTTKRGKAAKAALNMFLGDKSASQHEKDLLKSTKDQDVAKNFPGKVKVSAPMMHKK